MDPSDNTLVAKCTDVSNALVYGLLVGSVEPSGGHTSNHNLAISEDVELRDMMCAGVLLAILSYQQHSLSSP